jgi:putative CocE/NonD family hydrolase
LLRSPYLLEGSDAVVPYLSGFTDEGYALVVQAVRGTATSEGTLHPLAQEFPDGHDTVDWLIAQPWSNGRVGTFGASYEGFTAGAAAVESPEVDVVVMDGAITRAFEGWPGQRGIGVSYGMLMWWTSRWSGCALRLPLGETPDEPGSPPRSRAVDGSRRH